MFTRRPRPIAEHEATGDTSRIYHEIRQTLRVSGVNLNFRTWAGYEEFFSEMWAAIQPVAASQAFEAASNELRGRAADMALRLPPLELTATPGESQRFQIQRALRLYHYINPKLLLLTTIVRRGLAGEQSRDAGASPVDLGPKVPFGVPAAMAPMEMVDERPADTQTRRVFRDIQKTMRLSAVNSDYRTLALWPDYLSGAWAALKPLVRSKEYREAVAGIGGEAARLGQAFPVPTSINARRLKHRGERVASLIETTEGFERLLPGLILNIAVWSRAWTNPEELRKSPFPLVTGDAEQRQGM